MSSTVSQTCLEANLACLGALNADVADLIRRTPVPKGLIFEPTKQDRLTAALDGAYLASRHRPWDEAERLAAGVDILNHAVFVVFGFGVGHHVEALARRLDKTGVILVFEPDAGLLRAVFERIDCTDWLNATPLVFINDPDDRAALGRKLHGAEGIIAQGVALIEHPASRSRIGDAARAFSRTVADTVTTAKTTLVTTLIRSVDTCRNLLLNADHYAAGDGVAELKDAAKNKLAVVVSAGPSLSENLHLLADPDVRAKCVVIAVQTVLKPMLAAGVKPDYVTALDFHEISRRFYEGLTEADVEGVTLVIDPKVHPVVAEAFPGPVRCCRDAFMDDVLGPMKRDMGDLPPGSTVAHLALYLADHMGCNPIALIGQDLGFTDNLYYAPGAAIHEDVWAPELNPFNSLAMMEWQRIARNRRHLHKTRDIHGRSIYTDAQMLTYLQQFERNFAECEERGVTIIDATEGGVAKQHTTAETLRETLERHARAPIGDLPRPSAAMDPNRLAQGAERMRAVMDDIETLRDISVKTIAAIKRMIADRNDRTKFKKHYRTVDRLRAQVGDRLDVLELLNHVNQLGVFKRMKADRRLHLASELTPDERQTAQLDRDLVNVTWIRDAAEEFLAQLDSARRTMLGETVSPRPRFFDPQSEIEGEDGEAAEVAPERIAALVPVDSARTEMLAETIEGRSILQATLERLGTSEHLEFIILVVPEGVEVDPLFDSDRIGPPVIVERSDPSAFNPEHDAVAAARAFAPSCWRGAIGGLSIYDEVLRPKPMHAAMVKHQCTAALIVGPDWPLLNMSAEDGCDAVIARRLECPSKHNLVFSQAPPGLGGCVVATSLMAELTVRTRKSSIGGLLVYQPHQPQADPIANEPCIQVDRDVRASLIRATADSPQRIELVRKTLQKLQDGSEGAQKTVRAFEAVQRNIEVPPLQHVILELTTERRANGAFTRAPHPTPNRGTAPVESINRIIDQLAEREPMPVVTIAGSGDPLLHPHFDDVIARCTERGLTVHVRTELSAEPSVIDRLIATPPAVVSVDLNADRAATYEAMMGHGGFRAVLDNLFRLMESRTLLAGPDVASGFTAPWIVPRLQRCVETHEDIDSFFDRWTHTLSAAVIDAPPPYEPTNDFTPDALRPAVTPPVVAHRELLQRMVIRCDGSVPISELDIAGEDVLAGAFDSPVDELWRELTDTRTQRMEQLEPNDPALRLAF